MLKDNIIDKYIIYIGRKLNTIDGGSIVSKRNVEMLRKISEGKIIEFYLGNNSLWDKFKNIITGKPWGYSKQVCDEIKSVMCLMNVSFVFIDHSLLGKIINDLKDFNVEIVAFFHNIEFKYYKDKVKIDGFINSFMVKYAKINEKFIVKHAHKIICLTNIDDYLLYSIYGRKADLILPITIDDKYDNSQQFNLNEKYHLFVGSYFFANIDAISWYVKNVLSFVDSKLVIIGSGMEKLNDYSQFRENSKIEIKGFVENLNLYYKQADFVINPVRYGSGMKTKTIEAFMHGKVVIGTEDAFVGIEDVHKKRLGYVCNSAKEFISKINNFNDRKFSQFSRDYYLNNFSAEVGYHKLKDFLMDDY